jgi:hypothetical protein
VRPWLRDPKRGAYRARRGRRLRPASVWPAASLLFLTLWACEGVQVGGDALSMNLPPRQAQVCRDAVRDAMAARNVTAEWIRRVHYQAILRRMAAAPSSSSSRQAVGSQGSGRGARVKHPVGLSSGRLSQRLRVVVVSALAVPPGCGSPPILMVPGQEVSLRRAAVLVRNSRNVPSS